MVLDRMPLDSGSARRVPYRDDVVRQWDMGRLRSSLFHSLCSLCHGSGRSFHLDNAIQFSTSRLEYQYSHSSSQNRSLSQHLCLRSTGRDGDRNYDDGWIADDWSVASPADMG